CLTGTVPFQGSTGPAILLAILTKDPAPPSETGKAHGVPKTLDDVMEEALTKDPAIRIGTVAALADRVGLAYGLTGTHLDWAKITQADLGARIKAGLPGLLQQAAAAPPPPDTKALDAAFKQR